jgi:putative ABC transport system substrate-binding protein
MISHPILSFAQEPVIVQNIIIQPYEKLVKSIRENYPNEIKRFILSEYTGKDLVRDIKANNPPVIITIGIDAFKFVEKNFDNIPIISLMIPQTNSIKKDVINIPMILELEKQITIINNILHGVKSIGVIYSDDLLSQIIKAKEVANILGLNLVAYKIHSNKEIPKVLNDLKNRIDVLWIIPDFDVLTPETIEFFLLFSVENQKPIITFSSKYVYQGALMSIETDIVSMGKQTAILIEQLISGKKPNSNYFSLKPIITINGKIAKKLRINFNKLAIKEAKIIE